MLRTAVLALAGLALSLPAPATAQSTNWRADVHLCDEDTELPTCADAAVTVLGRRLTFAVTASGNGALYALDLTIPGLFQAYLGANRHPATDWTTDLFGDSFLAYSGYGDTHTDFADLNSLPPSPSAPYVFSFLLTNPIPISDAAIGVGIGTVRYRDLTGVPDPIIEWYESSDGYSTNAIITQVAPEPATMLLLGTGLVGVAVLRRRRRGGVE